MLALSLMFNVADATDIRQFLVCKYAHLQHLKMVDRTCIQEHIKVGLVEPLMTKIKEEIIHRIALALRNKRVTLEEEIAEVFDVHTGIETTCKEETDLRAILNPVKPVKRMLVDRPGGNGGEALGPRRGDYVYDVPVAQQLEKLLSQDATLMQACR